jgi:hypothetical protein
MRRGQRQQAHDLMRAAREPALGRLSSVRRLGKRALRANLFSPSPIRSSSISGMENDFDFRTFITFLHASTASIADATI